MESSELRKHWVWMIVWPASCVWRRVSISQLANYQITKLPLPPLSLSPGMCTMCFFGWREGREGRNWYGRGGGKERGGGGSVNKSRGIFQGLQLGPIKRLTEVWQSTWIDKCFIKQTKNTIDIVGVTCCCSSDWVRMVGGLDKKCGRVSICFSSSAVICNHLPHRHWIGQTLHRTMDRNLHLRYLLWVIIKLSNKIGLNSNVIFGMISFPYKFMLCSFVWQKYPQKFFSCFPDPRFVWLDGIYNWPERPKLFAVRWNGDLSAFLPRLSKVTLISSDFSSNAWIWMDNRY